MVSGYPDWHRGVKADIVNQTIENIKVDITQQTLPQISTTVVVSQFESIEWIIADSLTPVPPYSGETILIRAPEGYIYEILGIRLSADRPLGATVGMHDFDVRTESSDIGLLYGQSGYTEILRYDYGRWLFADLSAEPQTEIAQQMAVRNARVDSVNGLYITYHNATDVDQTVSRLMRLYVRKIKVEAT